MRVSQLHGWKLAPVDAVQLQRALRTKVRIAPLGRRIRRVAGIDVGIRDGLSTGAVVVCKYPELDPIEVVIASRPVEFPYVPGLLSFRECPVLADALAKVERSPDLLIVDGQGVAHPRRLGLASHLGLLVNRPSIGCAKSRLCGTNREPGSRRGCRTQLRDTGEVIGAVVRTRESVKPVYISAGHRITHEEAVRIVLACGSGYRLPEPIRLAHRAAAGQAIELAD